MLQLVIKNILRKFIFLTPIKGKNRNQVNFGKITLINEKTFKHLQCF